MKKTVVELFAGVGGFRVGMNHIKNFDQNTGLAIENGNWDFVWANQWEPSSKNQDAYNCYVTRFGHSINHVNEDIMPIANSEKDSSIIPSHTILVGGFPCQDYSVARSKSGEKGIEGKKGVLFWSIRDIIDSHKTPFVLLENVDRLLKSPANQRGRDFGIMLRTFCDLGYNLEWRVINAADYGRYQKRRRIFIFAWRNNLNFNKKYEHSRVAALISNEGFFSKPFPVDEITENDLIEIDLTHKSYIDTVEITSNFSARFQNSGVLLDGIAYTARTEPKKSIQVKLRDILEAPGNIDSDLFITEDRKDQFLKLKNGKRIERTDKKTGYKYYYSEGKMDFPDNLDKPSRTMLTSESSLNRSTHIIESEAGKLRYISPVEAERLNDFPSNWTNTGMTRKRRYFMMGNALVTGIISSLEPVLSKIVEDED